MGQYLCLSVLCGYIMEGHWCSGMSVTTRAGIYSTLRFDDLSGASVYSTVLYMPDGIISVYI